MVEKVYQIIKLLFVGAALLAVGACNSRKDEGQLFVAIIRNEMLTTKMLLDAGVNVDCQQQSLKRETPLIFAVYFGNLEIVELILQYSPNLEAIDSQGMTALCHALTSPYFNKEDPSDIDRFGGIIEALVNNGASTSNPCVLQAIAVLDKTDPRLSALKGSASPE